MTAPPRDGSQERIVGHASRRGATELVGDLGPLPHERADPRRAAADSVQLDLIDAGAEAEACPPPCRVTGEQHAAAVVLPELERTRPARIEAEVRRGGPEQWRRSDQAEPRVRQRSREVLRWLVQEEANPPGPGRVHGCQVRQSPCPGGRADPAVGVDEHRVGVEGLAVGEGDAPSQPGGPDRRVRVGAERGGHAGPAAGCAERALLDRSQRLVYLTGREALRPRPRAKRIERLDRIRHDDGERSPGLGGRGPRVGDGHVAVAAPGEGCDDAHQHRDGERRPPALRS